ncbi:hypothetical protein [Candidatus Nitrosocosmicus sp. SS]|uniref:hypothetical protein n=1 Tax=Candidatus Nitrosocosmicus agrestis TaxID=2563600 RepID=UPI00122E4255|nr:hypothetical protein [Candidatus Nitrosocosmicus sp. SS]KAA2283549.1 hypothetical protein F1Z66_01340 [Candidatus Nitrosocosmicus sp. SS]KAF0869630.1 hypothetical protein E5N71_03870 [Candidatus Nitrosocosmicus sp. SS]
MKPITQKTVNGFFIKTYEKYHNTISLNKNLLISGSAGFLSSIIIAHFVAEFSTSHVLNSAITVITGFLTYKVIFAILFHIDNKRDYTKRLTGKINFIALRRILIKMIFASTLFDTVNNLTRFLLIIQLLKLEYSAIEAATLSSLVASVLSYAIINLIVKYIHLFTKKR